MRRSKTNRHELAAFRVCLGYVLLAAVFGSIFIFGGHFVGFKAMAVIFAGAGAVVGAVGLAVYLISSD